MSFAYNVSDWSKQKLAARSKANLNKYAENNRIHGSIFYQKYMYKCLKLYSFFMSNIFLVFIKICNWSIIGKKVVTLKKLCHRLRFWVQLTK